MKISSLELIINYIKILYKKYIALLFKLILNNFSFDCKFEKIFLNGDQNAIFFFWIQFINYNVNTN